MTGFDSKRKMAQAKVNEDDDTQVYADTLTVVYQRGFADGKAAANAMHDLARLGQEIEQGQAEQCIGKDPRCPCQDGDACHYKDCVDTKARPVAKPEPLEYWNAVEGWVKIDEVREHFNSVGCGTIYKAAGEDRVPLYTAAQRRPWQGLTDDEFLEACQLAERGNYLVAFQRIQAKLKERNNDH